MEFDQYQEFIYIENDGENKESSPFHLSYEMLNLLNYLVERFTGICNIFSSMLVIRSSASEYKRVINDYSDDTDDGGIYVDIDQYVNSSFPFAYETSHTVISKFTDLISY